MIDRQEKTAGQSFYEELPMVRSVFAKSVDVSTMYTALLSASFVERSGVVQVDRPMTLIESSDKPRRINSSLTACARAMLRLIDDSLEPFSVAATEPAIIYEPPLDKSCEAALSRVWFACCSSRKASESGTKASVLVSSVMAGASAGLAVASGRFTVTGLTDTASMGGTPSAALPVSWSLARKKITDSAQLFPAFDSAADGAPVKELPADSTPAEPLPVFPFSMTS